MHVMGRTDDIINVAGHRLSTGQIEQIIASHPAIAECAVIGANDSIKGMVPLALVVQKSGAAAGRELQHDIIALVRAELGPIAALKHVLVVDALPKTRSGKVLRAAIRRLANGEEIEIPATIENPAALTAIGSCFRAKEAQSFEQSSGRAV